MKVQNMTNNNGNDIPNQFIIRDKDKTTFESYSSIIAIRKNGVLTLDTNNWDYSRTTSKYRNVFTGLTTKETKEGIKNGSIKLRDLNK